MKITRGFEAMSDRYKYDFKHCTTDKGFAQIDTSQDASYYGHWANPFKLTVFAYIEGDLILSEAETVEEFVQDIREMKEFQESLGYKFLGIDPGFNKELENRFREIGLGDLLH